MESSLGPSAGTLDTSPTARLPTELIVSIFTELIAASGSDTTTRSWVELMLVCRRWRFIGVGTPQLWRDINISSNLEGLKYHLTRSRRYPLNLYLRSPQPSENLAPAIELLIPHCQRIRSIFVIVGYDLFHLLDPLFLQEMPRLASIFVSTPDDKDIKKDWRKAEYDMGISGLLQSQVHSFASARIQVPLDTFFWSTIREVDLTIHADHPLSLAAEDILEVVGTARHLRSIKIVWVFYHTLPPSRIRSAEDPPCPATTLHQLRSLYLSGPLLYLSTLLEGIHAPALKHLNIDTGASMIFSLPLSMFVVTLLPPTLDVFLSRFTALRVRGLLIELYVPDGIPEDGPTMVLDIFHGPFIPFDLALSSIRRAVAPKVPLTHLCVSEQPGPAPQEAWASLFTALPHLRALELDRCEYDVLCHTLKVLADISDPPEDTGPSTQAPNRTTAVRPGNSQRAVNGFHELSVRADVGNSAEAEEVQAHVHAIGKTRGARGLPLELTQVSIDIRGDS